jgi:P27 family predicted phage terminase small subunit
MVTEADRAALLALCQQWDVYLAALGRIRTLVVTTKTGYPLPNPHLSIANKALAQCIKLWEQLGCTPSARSRVVAVAESARDALETALETDNAPGRGTHDIN